MSSECLFCKIVSRQLPAQLVYEDELYLGFLDIRPEQPGHVQLIPKQHYRWVWDVPTIASYMQAAQKIALAQRKAFGTDFIVSRIVGDEVPHAHIWLVPHRHTQNSQLPAGDLSALIRQHLGMPNPSSL